MGQATGSPPGWESAEGLRLLKWTIATLENRRLEPAPEDPVDLVRMRLG